MTKLHGKPLDENGAIQLEKSAAQNAVPSGWAFEPCPHADVDRPQKKHQCGLCKSFRIGALEAALHHAGEEALYWQEVVRESNVPAKNERIAKLIEALRPFAAGFPNTDKRDYERAANVISDLL